MSRCDLCQRDGVVFVRGLDVDGYIVCACTCASGQRYRVKHQLRALVGRLEPAPLWFGRIEEFFDATELATFRTWPSMHPLDAGRELVRWDRMGSGE